MMVEVSLSVDVVPGPVWGRNQFSSTEVDATTVVREAGPAAELMEVVVVVDPANVDVQGGAGAVWVTVVVLVLPGGAADVCVTSWQPMNEEQNEEASRRIRSPLQPEILSSRGGAPGA